MASVPWLQVQTAIENQHKRSRNDSSGSEPESPSVTGHAIIHNVSETSIVAPSKCIQNINANDEFSIGQTANKCSGQFLATADSFMVHNCSVVSVY